MPNPNTNFKNSSGTDLGNILITKEYLMTVYPQIANQLITPELWVWGLNSYGQLGNNTSGTNKSTPVTTFSGGANWKQVDCGYNSTAAIKTDGTLWNWGRNNFAQLGNNLPISLRVTPIQTSAGGTNWKQVSCGYRHTAAIKTDGTLWNWGYNATGQLGNDEGGTSRCTPITTFLGGNTWKQVSCGYDYTAAIKTDGTLWTWGIGGSGRLGDNLDSYRLTPVTTFLGGNTWKQVSCGEAHTAAIKTDGTLWIWGSNSYAQIGDNTSGTDRLTPVTTFLGGANWKQVDCGYNSTAAIKTDGTLWTWGNNATGQLGNNTSGTNILTPVTTFLGGNNWKQVACGKYHIAAIKTDGTLWTWGDSSGGQLGHNTETNTNTPVTTFAGGTNWKQVACGKYHTVAIKTSDDLQGI